MNGKAMSAVSDFSINLELISDKGHPISLKASGPDSFGFYGQKENGTCYLRVPEHFLWQVIEMQENSLRSAVAKLYYREQKSIPAIVQQLKLDRTSVILELRRFHIIVGRLLCELMN